MSYVMMYARRVLYAALAVLAGWMLVPMMGAWPTLGLAALIAGVSVLVGGYLLKTSTLSTVTWKNRVAGYTIPWGWTLANGLLGRAMVASFVVWIALAGVGVLLRAGPTVQPFATSTHSATFWNLITLLLAVAWLVDGAALLYFVGVKVKSGPGNSSHHKTIFKAIALASTLLVVSVTLYLLGWPVTALIVAGGPPAAIASVYGLFLGVIFCLMASGKKIHWN